MKKYFCCYMQSYDIKKYDEAIIEKYVNHSKCVAIGEWIRLLQASEDEEEKENIKDKKRYLYLK